MTTWHFILIACIAAFALKLSGFFVPARVLDQPVVARSSTLMTVGLLAALVATQTVTSGQVVELDARVPAVLLAGLLLALRAPFVVVVLVAAVAAALLRALAWMP